MQGCGGGERVSGGGQVNKSQAMDEAGQGPCGSCNQSRHELCNAADSRAQASKQPNRLHPSPITWLCCDEDHSSSTPICQLHLHTIWSAGY